MNKRKRYLFILLSLFAFILLFPAYSFSAFLSLKDVIKWGVSHNNALQEIVYQINNTKRALKEINAKMDWQVDLSGKYDTKKVSTSINIAKSLTDTLTMEIDISLNSENNGELAYSTNSRNKTTITLNERLYPATPNENKINYIETYNDLVKLESRLIWKREEIKRKIISDFLNLLRLKKLYEINKLNYTFFQKKLNEAKALYEMKEIDKSELYTAQINFKDAEYTVKESKIKFEKAKREFHNFLNLPEGYELTLEEDDPYINELQKDMGNISSNIENLLSELKDIHPDLISYKVDLKLMEKRVKWVKDGDKPKLSLRTDYDFLSGDFGIYLLLDYNIIDSGEQRLKEKDNIEKLKKVKLDYHEQIKKIKEDILFTLETIKLDKIKVEEKELAYEKAKYEEKAAKERLKKHAITKIDYEKILVNLKRAYIDLKSAYDTLLIDKLKLAQLGGYKIK